MPLSDTARAQWQIHFCVLLWGFTAILGKLITLPALPLVWWRMLIVTAVLALVPRVWRALRAMPIRVIASYAGIGIFVALHWLTFYGSIKLANASVAATCMALATVFTALFEPQLAQRAFSRRELLLGIAVLPGVALVVGGVPEGMRSGIAVGALSAMLVAVFSSLNKRMVAHGDPLAVTAIELGTGVLLLTVLAPLMPAVFPVFAGDLLVLPDRRDFAYLIALAVLCTLVPFALSLVALRHMSAFAAQLAVNLEPVYAMVLAVLLLGEQRQLSATFYLGVAILLITVMVYPVLQKPKHLEGIEQIAVSESRDMSN